jgi:ribosome maturation factor RimP
MELKKKIENLAQTAISGDQFLVDVVVSSKPPRKLTVVLDADRGVTIDDCASVSHRLLELLEEQKITEDSFTLEVTTPGIDHPLKMRRQYFKNIGRDLKVKLRDNTVEIGKLVEVNDEAIAIEQVIIEGKKKKIRKTDLRFSEIERAIVQISFK